MAEQRFSIIFNYQHFIRSVSPLSPFSPIPLFRLFPVMMHVSYFKTKSTPKKVNKNYDTLDYLFFDKKKNRKSAIKWTSLQF